MINGFDFKLYINEISAISAQEGGSFNGNEYGPKVILETEKIVSDGDDEKKINLTLEIRVEDYKDAIALRDMFKKIRSAGVVVDFPTNFPSLVSKNNYKAIFFGNLDKYLIYLNDLLKVKK